MKWAVFQAIFVSLGLAGQLLSVPALTEGQLLLLGHAREGGPLVDEPAFYPLVDNVLKWSGDSTDEAGASVPHYAKIIADPKQARGKLFLIEGDLLRYSDPGTFALPGPWEGKWRQWVVQWGTAPGQLAVVYLINPPEDPRIIQSAYPKVRLPARFFKTWENIDQEDFVTNYLVFVGSSATVLWQPAIGAPQARRSKKQVDRLLVVGVLVVIMAAAFLFFRRRLTTRAKPLAVQERIAHDLQGYGSPPSKPMVDPQDQNRHDLPHDPAQALEVLEKESDQDQGSNMLRGRGS